jgi:hypothetical protein
MHSSVVAVSALAASVCAHPHHLVAFGPDADGWDVVLIKLLDQVGAGARILDKEDGLLQLGPTFIDLDRLALKRRKIQSHAHENASLCAAAAASITPSPFESEGNDRFSASVACHQRIHPITLAQARALIPPSQRTC